MSAAGKAGPWPNGARAAIAVTIDNMGEAADLDRNLWPQDQPIGSHYSVTEVIPQMLELLKKYDMKATYFIESWNMNVYPKVITDDIAKVGHEVAWHAWRHEAWSKLKDEKIERANIERSFSDEGVGQFTKIGVLEPYRGFRPPGGIIHGERTLKLCREYGLDYISPAGHDAALVPIDGGKDNIVVLPFRWSTVDAYYYMTTFAGLRRLKGEIPEAPQSPEVFLARMKEQIDEAIQKGGYLSVLCHPFLTNEKGRLQVADQIYKYLAEKRDKGEVWLAPCKDIADYIKEHPDIVEEDPGWDTTSWR